MVNKRFVKKIITILFLIQPILEAYYFKGRSGTVSDYILLFLILCTIPLLMINHKLSLKFCDLEFFPFFLLIFVNFIRMLSSSTFSISQFSDYLRVIAYYFIVIFLIKRFGDIKFAKKTMEMLSVVLCVYCLLQYIFMLLFRIYLPSYFPFFEHRADLDREQAYINYPQYYRPHAIFSEPAHFCEFILIYLALLLFENKQSKYSIFMRVFTTFVLFVTGSSTGIVGSVILWGLYGILNYKGKLRIGRNKLWLFLILFTVAIVVIVRSTTFSIFVSRFLISDSSIEGRLGNVARLFGDGLKNAVFGYGLNYDYIISRFGWLPGYALCYAYFGGVGLLMFLWALFSIYKKLGKNKKTQIALLCLFFLLNCATEIMLSPYLIVYLLFILGEEERDYDSIHAIS